MSDKAMPAETPATEDAEEAKPEAPGPNEMRDPLVRTELKRAAVWIGMAVAVVGAWYLAPSLLLIFGGVVVAAMLDGGVRLLGRVLPIARGLRLAIVILLVLAFFTWVVMLTGSSLADQAESLKTTVVDQANRLIALLQRYGLLRNSGAANQISSQLMGSFGRLTSVVGSAAGAFTSAIMIFVIGIFLAMEPRLYERGIAWMLPVRSRDGFYEVMQAMGYTLRRLMAARLLGMAGQGFLTYVLLALFDIPMAGLLGMLTGLLAFLPNIGAFISGVLVVLVGFSAGTESGLYALGVYLTIQFLEGYIITPTVARKSVDLAPALVLGAQLLFGTLFGLLGLMFADPIVAMLKVWLEKGARRNNGASAPPAPDTISFRMTHTP